MKAIIYLLQSTREFDVAYTYLAGTFPENGLRPGCFVEVPFGRQNRVRTGLVWTLEREENGDMAALKQIRSVRQDLPCLTPKEMALCSVIQERYFCTMGEAVRCLLPPEGGKGRLLNGIRPAGSREDFQRAVSDGSLRSIQQIQVLEYYLRTERVWEEWTPVSLLSASGGLSAAAINTLVKKGFFTMEKQVWTEPAAPLPEREAAPSPVPPLTEEQTAVCRKLEPLLQRREFAEVLLQGVTGSGKTEVYLNLISIVLRRRGKAVVLVPEISLTPQMTERFVSRFGRQVAVLHSRLSDTERNREWRRIREGGVSVVLGVRSAVFAPFDHVDLFVLDEEQEPTYKSEEMAPRYHAGDIAVIRAKQDGGLVLYGSATPRLETAYRARKGEIVYCRLEKRANQAALPAVELVDMRREWEEGSRGLFSRTLLSEIKQNLQRGEQTILFVNRRGYAKQVLCRSCGAVMKCGKCNIAMAYHVASHRLICHYCGNTVPLPPICPKCGSDRFEQKGCGTEQVEQALFEQFPGCRVVRMDLDTTAGREGHQRQILRFQKEKADFLVGTQMVAKGHDFPLVTLVGVLAADNLLAIQDYRAEERAFQLLTQVAGRAGRGRLAGRVVIQAFNIDDYAFTTAAKQDYEAFYQNEIAVRQTLWYPPFCRMGRIALNGSEDRAVYDLGLDLRKRLEEAARSILPGYPDAGLEILGPTREAVPKCNDRYRWQIILKGKEEETMRLVTARFLSGWAGIKKKKDCRIAVDF